MRFLLRFNKLVVAGIFINKLKGGCSGCKKEFAALLKKGGWINFQLLSFVWRI